MIVVEWTHHPFRGAGQTTCFRVCPSLCQHRCLLTRSGLGLPGWRRCRGSGRRSIRHLLHPDTKAVAVITNESETEKDYLVAVGPELRHNDKLKEIDLVGPPSGQMLERIAAPSSNGRAISACLRFRNSRRLEPLMFWIPRQSTLLTYSFSPSLAYDHGGIGGAA